MSAAIVSDSEIDYVTVEFADRVSDALFLLEIAVHHRGDKIVAPGPMFPPHWRSILRHCHVDVYGPKAERWLMLAARWAFLQSRVVHAPGCSPIACQARYHRRDATFVCERCHRRCGWCFGASDEHPEYCDDCWCEAEAPFELSRVIRRSSLTRAIASREAERIGADEAWVDSEIVAIDFARANAAFPNGIVLGCK